jgi:hypothetical protein
MKRWKLTSSPETLSMTLSRNPYLSRVMGLLVSSSKYFAWLWALTLCNTIVFGFFCSTFCDIHLYYWFGIVLVCLYLLLKKYFITHTHTHTHTSHTHILLLLDGFHSFVIMGIMNIDVLDICISVLQWPHMWLPIRHVPGLGQLGSSALVRLYKEIYSLLAALESSSPLLIAFGCQPAFRYSECP